MTKAKMLGGWRIGGALIGAAMAVSGCAGAGTSASTASLDDVSTVSSSIDGRTDLFYDPALSTHLITADEVNGSPTAVAVEVQVTDSMLIAWRAQPSVPVADRSRTEADIVAAFRIVGTSTQSPDLSTAVAIDNETHPGDPSRVVVPSGVIGGLTGGRATGSTATRPPLTFLPMAVGLTINWTNVNGIPNAVDVNTYHNIVNAHPGCA